PSATYPLPLHDALPISLLLDHLYGATVYLVGDDRVVQTRRQVELAAELEARGEVVYLAPQATDVDKPLHAAAYASGAVELLDQADRKSTRLNSSHVKIS